MTLDQRTPQEIAYDNARLSRTPAQPIADKPLSADEERALNIILKHTPRLNDDGTPNKYDTGEWSMQWLEVQTPLVTFPDGSRIVGTHDTDGSPWCARLIADNGEFSCGPDGSMSGDWADVAFWDLTVDQIEKLRALFNSPLLPALIDAAKAWCKP